MLGHQPRVFCVRTVTPHEFLPRHRAEARPHTQDEIILPDQQVAEVKGNWKGWDFRFLSKSGREIGTVTKKWAGLGKELFTSADNYVISLTDLGGAGQGASALLLAAGLSIDIVFKEQG